MRRVTIACSSRSLAERSRRSPRWSSTAGSALRRVEPASASVAARSPSRRISSSGEAATNAASPRPAQTRWQDGNASRRTPRTAAGSWSTGAWTWTSRARTILSSSPALDPLDRARDRLLVVLGRHRARRRGSGPPGAGSSSGSGARRAARRRGARCARDEVLGRVVGLRERRRRSGGRRRRGARARPRGRAATRRRSRPSAARAPPSGGEGEAADGDRAGAARAVGRVARGAATPARASAWRRAGSGPARRPRSRPTQPERGERGAVAVGLLEAEPRLVARRRAAATTALGSVAARRP